MTSTATTPATATTNKSFFGRLVGWFKTAAKAVVGAIQTAASAVVSVFQTVRGAVVRTVGIKTCMTVGTAAMAVVVGALWFVGVPASVVLTAAVVANMAVVVMLGRFVMASVDGPDGAYTEATLRAVGVYTAMTVVIAVCGSGLAAYTLSAIVGWLLYRQLAGETGLYEIGQRWAADPA